MDRELLLWQINDLIRQLAWQAMFQAIVHDFEEWKLFGMVKDSATLHGTS